MTLLVSEASNGTKTLYCLTFYKSTKTKFSNSLFFANNFKRNHSFNQF